MGSRRGGDKAERRMGYLEKLASGEKTLNNRKDAEQMFRSLLRKKDAPEQVALCIGPDLLPVLKDALAMMNDDSVQQPLELLSVLGAEKLSYGMYRQKVVDIFTAFYEAPGFLQAVKVALLGNSLGDPAAVAWMLLKLAPELEEVRHCSSETVRDIVELLKASTAKGMAVLVPQLATLFVTFEPADDPADHKGGPSASLPESLHAAKRAQRPPGTREHDNDHRDFRSISIVPTPAELNCDEPPYLPPADGCEAIPNKEAAILDRQFRLLREDLLGSVRAELAEELAESSPRHLYPQPAMVGILADPQPCVLLRVPLPGRIAKRVRGMKAAEAREFFHNGPGRRILAQGTLTLLLQPKQQQQQKQCSDGSRRGLPPMDVVAVGMVVIRRHKAWDILRPDEGELQVGVSFLGASSHETVAEKLTGLTFRKKAPVLSPFLLSSSVGFFTYEPVLRALQQMPGLPLSDTLAYLKTPSAPDLPHGDRRLDELSAELHAFLGEDETQAAALQLAMTSKVALVQGPPGTGKTHIGVVMVKAMLEAHAKWGDAGKKLRVLCLCYTNHALDSFLESLMDAGVPPGKFIRLGSSNKVSNRLRPRCLRELPDAKFDAAASRGYAILKTEQEGLMTRMTALQEQLTERSQWGTGLKWWPAVSEFLEDEYYHELEQLTVPDGFGSNASSASSDGWQLATGGSKDFGANYLWMRWCAGKNRGVLQRTWGGVDEDSVNLWAMSGADRQQLKRRWNQEWLKDLHQQLADVMQELSKNASGLEDLRRSNDSRTLRDATIIGCTTVGAAKLRGMLQEVAPDVVLVEEAGEILEAHVLSTIGHRCKQLILIGDHKQLRPKAECYRLRRESGQGFDLDVSLFERLVTHTMPDGDVLPMATLKVQHRMRPEVSELVRRTMYPDLRDHVSTLDRPKVKGVAKPVLFISHDREEIVDAEAADLGSHSRVNRHEVEMVCRLAKHLLRQDGCEPGNITILTPYLGQLSEIRRRLVQLNVGADVNDRDANDLTKLNLMAADGNSGGSNSNSDSAKPAVRAATVDNFQGEESDIVIISLVRSNRQGDIGFLSSEQRVNVLLSRARNGMYVFGNMSCLTNSRTARGRDLWQRLKTVLVEKGQLAEFLPLVCERHQSLLKLREPEDFERLSPQGGCTMPCTTILPCGHSCPLSCHPGDHTMHKHVKCTQEVADVCSYGHPGTRQCSQSSVTCQKSVRWKCPEGHTLTGLCNRGRAVSNCLVCKQLRRREEAFAAAEVRRRDTMQQQEAKLAELQAQMKEMLSKEADQAELDRIQKEQELTTRMLQDSAARERGNIARPLTCAAPPPPPPTPPQKIKDVSHVPAVGDTATVGAAEAKAATKLDQQVIQEPAAKALEVQKIPSISADTAESVLAAVLEVYQSKGPLQADDLLDRHGHSSDEPMPEALQAMRYITARELDPNGTCTWMQTDDGMTKAGASISTLSQAVCTWASYLEFKTRYPLQALQNAKALVSFHHCSVVGSLLPVSWMEEATETCTSPAVATPQLAPAPAPSQQTVPSTARWDDLRAQDPDIPEVLREVLAMTGLDEVKDAMINQYHVIRLAYEQGDAGGASSYNVRFDGNPGTGKTTVARHYGIFLQQLKVLPKKSLFVELSGAGLVTKGVQHLETKLEELKAAGGGVVFVDEAYQLVSDRMGRQVLDFILPLAEGLDSKYGALVWVFAGYHKDMERLFEHNVGLKSRFPLHFEFKDYTDEQLLLIFKGFMAGDIRSPAGGGSTTRADQVEKQAGIKMPARDRRVRNLMSYTYQRRVGEVAEDNFGNSWTWKGSGWYDQYGNVSGLGPNDDLGTSANPVVAPDGKQWTLKGSQWHSTHGDNQGHYPGSPAPPPAPRTTSFTCRDEKALRIAMRRLGRRRGQAGFGNARAVRATFDAVRSRQAQRLIADGKQADIFEFTATDLLGLPPTQARLRQTEAYKALQAMEGLKPVKEQVDQLLRLVESNWTREQREMPPLDVALNRVFLGNPGTGKTTVAALYGRILGELGLLSKGDVVMKNPSDFVGDVLGSSEKATRDILKAAEGCVLVIDEAYGLFPGGSSGVGGGSDPYKSAVLDTLVEQVQGKASDDRAVVLLGYEEEMRRMMKDSNPGLARRFQLDFAFVFPDYSDEALLRILMAKARSDGLEVQLDVAKKAVATLAGSRAKPNFGNAGAVDNLLSQAKLRMQCRAESGSKLLLVDFGIDPTGADDEAQLNTLFDDLIGCDEVRNQLERLRDTVSFSKDQGESVADVVGYNYIFTGNPGTGKTTVARRMGQMFYSLGLLPDKAVNEVSASDLVTGYAGQAGKKMRDVLQQSRGGVLFIDEAYQLNPRRGGPYMTEVVDELVGSLTSEDFKSKLLVILAGYKGDMEEMLKTNPGLRSRFCDQLHFEDLTSASVQDIALAKMKLPFADCARRGLPALATELLGVADFSNGRDVDTWCQMTFQEVAVRVVREKSCAKEVTVADLKGALARLVATRLVSSSEEVSLYPSTTLHPPSGPLPQLQRQQHETSSTKGANTFREVAARIRKRMHAESDEDDAMDWDLLEEEDAANVEVDRPHRFEEIDQRVLRELQDVLEAMGLNNEEGMNRVATLSPQDPEFASLRDAMVKNLSMSPKEAHQQLTKWQSAQKSLQEEVQKQREALKLGKLLQEPIRRCAVCGEANKPYIACWVAPYVVGYQPVRANE